MKKKRRCGREDDGLKPAASDKGWGGGAAGEARSGLKVEGASDVQRVGGLAERTKRLAEKEESPTKLHYALQYNIDSLVLEALVRNRCGSGQPPEAAVGLAAS